MPIQVNLDRQMFEKKVSLTVLAGKIDLTLANLSILKNNKARAIRFSTLEALCRELECQPRDLLEYVTARAKRTE
jgi:putative transcriptional regulator